MTVHIYRLVSLLILSPVLASSGPIVFSTFPSASIPEGISQAPNTFGSHGGQFFVPDATNNSMTDAPGIIWTVPMNGGGPTMFASTPYNPRGSIFLPNNFGSFAGGYAVANFAGNAIVGVDTVTNFGAITVYGPTGTQSTLYSATNFLPVTFAVAPSGFDSVGGQLLASFTGTVAGITAIDSSGNRTDLASGFPFAPFGVSFAPTGFGSFGGNLFFDSDRTPVIDMMDPSGKVSTFTTLPLPGNQGTRFMGFAPSGFGQFGGDLIVSVAGSSFSASDGRLLVIGPDGSVVGQLTGLNPRGFTFTNGGTQMLVNDTEPRVLEFGPNDFAAVPEPGSLVLVGLGLAACVASRGRNARGRFSSERC